MNLKMTELFKVLFSTPGSAICTLILFYIFFAGIAKIIKAFKGKPCKKCKCKKENSEQ